MLIATLVAKDVLGAATISQAEDALRATGASEIAAETAVSGKAVHLRFAGDLRAARLALEALPDEVDVIVQQESHRRRRLLVADMDSTMITVECIDELADYAGIKAEIAEITERAMRGELDFEEALTHRVGLLAGLSESVIQECLAERVKLMPGAVELVAAIHANGGKAILVSGGFTHFAEPVGRMIGFDHVVANRLGIAGGALDGSVHKPIVGAERKREELLAALARHGWTRDDALAVGDGANDIPMIREAGLGIAYHAKPVTRDAADAAIRFGSLEAMAIAIS